MAFLVHWYHLLCLAVVVGAVAGSLWAIFRRSECGRHRDHDTKHESLLAAGDGSMTSYVGSCQLWMSRWRGVHPVFLLAFRLLAAVTMAAVLFWDIRTYDFSIMLYYTEWTFTLVIIYFLIATSISAHGCWIYSKHVTEIEEADGFIKRDCEENMPAMNFGPKRNRKAIKLQRYYEQGENEQKAGFWGYIMQVTYQTSAGAVVLTDVVFWVLLVPFLSAENFSLDLVMGCMHSLNLVFLVLDTALNSLPFPWFRMAYFVLWSCIYVIFQWVLHACGFSWWPYPFLELSTPWAPLWYLSLALVHFPCYGLYSLIAKVKITFFTKFFSHVCTRLC
ncbi:uncharacterized protein [Elaeis guineensis]|uniref:uncharacterized protein isoform X1 n=1 Tax=Elaeis guineensis var. tenera TaxID=51953 RepID=UPI003C6D7F55